MAETRKTFCRNCTAHCPMELTVEDNRIVRVASDPTSSPYGGPYICVKGEMSADLHNGGQGRLIHSLQRSPAGDFRPIATSAALDEIAGRLTALVDEHGPRSIAVYRGTGAAFSALTIPFLSSWMSALGSPNIFSSMTIDQSAKWVTMMRMGFMASGKPNLDTLDLAMIVGSNPLVSHQTYPYSAGQNAAPARAYAEARKRGFRLIVVDPRRTETARHADLLIQPLPGEDATLFAGMIHLLIRNGGQDEAFCERFVGQFEALRAAVADFTPEHVAARADIPVEQLETAVRWLSESRRVHCGSGTGPNMSARSNLAEHLIETLNALLGGYYRAGDIVHNPGVLKPRRRVERVVPPSRAWEKGVKCRTADIGKFFGEFPTGVLPDEILEPGPNKIRAMICVGGNPAMALVDPEKTLAAFRDLELLVVIDPILTQTARLADYVIAPALPFERHDLTAVVDGAFPRAFAQYTAPVVDKPPETIDDWRFFWGLGSRMGLEMTFKAAHFGTDFEAVRGGVPLDMCEEPDEEMLLAWLCKDSAVSFEALKAADGGICPDIEPHSGQAAPDDGARLELCPDDVAEELAELRLEPIDGRFRYRLTSRRILEAMNGAYRDSERTRRRFPVNWAYMSDSDMEAERLSDGDMIEIASEFGAIMGVIKTDSGLRRGVISMTHLFGELAPSTDPYAQRGSHTGRLSSLSARVEAINRMPLQSGIPVNIRPAISADRAVPND